MVFNRNIINRARRKRVKSFKQTVGFNVTLNNGQNGRELRNKYLFGRRNKSVLYISFFMRHSRPIVCFGSLPLQCLQQKFVHVVVLLVLVFLKKVCSIVSYNNYCFVAVRPQLNAEDNQSIFLFHISFIFQELFRHNFVLFNTKQFQIVFYNTKRGRRTQTLNYVIFKRFHV